VEVGDAPVICWGIRLCKIGVSKSEMRGNMAFTTFLLTQTRL
jgi:hypothetical protein